MGRLPDCVVVVDAEVEDIAIKEARKIKIPVIALIDTNCDPNVADFPIPGNDDAIRSISYVVSQLANAAEKGFNEFNSGKGIKDLRSKHEVKAEVKPEMKVEVKVVETPIVETKDKAEREAEPEEVSVEEAGIEEVADGDIKLDNK